jgi:hypothetical protein
VLIAVVFTMQGAASAGAVRPPAADSHRVALGVYVPEALRQPARIDRYVRLMRREPLIISAYMRWPSPPFVHARLDEVWKRGAVPMITWEPWTDADRGFSLSAIADGTYDGYLIRAAEAAGAWGHPILLRFAPEMNGTWYPWGRGKEGNTPELYKRAWRRLVGIFSRHRAHNVKWVWTPNETSRGRFPFPQYYPGDRWVDWVGLDGYNWGSPSEWTSFTGVFAGSYDALRRLTSRPVMITETGSSGTGGNKAAWVDSALSREIPRFTAIGAVIWFDAPFPRVDARVDRPADVLRAFRAAASSPRYALTRAEFLAFPHRLYRQSLAPQPPSGGYGEPSFAYRLVHKLHGRYLWYGITTVIAGLSALVVCGTLLRRRLRAGAKRSVA